MYAVELTYVHFVCKIVATLDVCYYCIRPKLCAINTYSYLGSLSYVIEFAQKMLHVLPHNNNC